MSWIWNYYPEYKINTPNIKLLLPIENYCPEYKIIVPNIKLLSAECECESECDGNFYVAFKDADDNNGIVNSHMYNRQAIYFASKKRYEEAKKYLTIGN